MKIFTFRILSVLFACAAIGSAVYVTTVWLHPGQIAMRTAETTGGTVPAVPDTPPAPKYDTTRFEVFDTESTITPPFPMPSIIQPVFPDRNCVISDYGAVPDRKTKNSKPIEDAVADCERQGGGHVVIPTGTWLTGAIHLDDNIDLHLEDGAVLSFSTDPTDYLPVVLTRYEGIDLYNYSPLIYANGKHNLAITGNGKLVGNGAAWWNTNDVGVTHSLYAMGDAGTPLKDRVFGSTDRMLRPAFVEFIHSGSILLSDFTVESGPMWTLHPTYSDDIVIRNVTVLTSGKNNDGLDIDSSRNVVVERSHFDSHDDAIVIKSGKARDGLLAAAPSENIVIRNDSVTHGHGAVAIGSEIAGGVRNVFAYGCAFNGSQYGIRLKALENEKVSATGLWFQDISMDNILFDAIQLTMHYGSDQASGDTGVPVFDGIRFTRISDKGSRGSIEIDSLEQSPATSVAVEHSGFVSGSGPVIKNVNGFSVESTSISAKHDPLYAFTNGRNVSIDKVTCPADMKVCMTFDGSLTRGIVLSPSADATISAKKMQISSDVPDGQVSF